MASPAPSQSSNANANANATGSSAQTDAFPLDFLSFSNFDNKGDTSQSQSQMGMDFDFSQFQMDHQSPRGHGDKRGSVSSSVGPTNGAGMEVDGHGQGQGQFSDFQVMLEAAAASAAAGTAPGGNNSETSTSGSRSFDQAGLLQQQLEHIHMQSPLVFGQMNGTNPAAGAAAGTSNQSQGQGLSPYNALAQYLASPLAQSQHIGDGNGNGNGNSQEGGSDAEKRKWMLATGLGGLFTPGPSGEMIPQVRPEHMSPMQLELLAREGLEGDFSHGIPLLSPALSHQQNNSTYTSPMVSASFSSGTSSGNPATIPFSPHVHPPSPLEALQIQQRHFQEQLALLQHQQRQLQATAEAVAASQSPYVGPGGPPSASASSSASRPATTPGHGALSSNTSPSYFSPLTSPALEARRQNHQQHHFSPGFDPRANNRRTPHPLSALSSPALNPIGSSGGAQQTLSPALAPQSNNDLSDPEYLRVLSGMLDQSNNHVNGSHPGSHTPHQGPSSAHPSPMPMSLHSIDTAALSSPMVGPLSAGSSAGPGPNRHSLPARTRPSPMIKPTPAQRGHHSRNGSLHQSPSITTGQHQRHIPTVPQPNYLPPAAIDQRGVQAHQHHQHQQQHMGSETPSPVDLSTIMPPPPLPNGNGHKTVTPMTPAALMNLGGGSRPPVESTAPVSVEMPAAPKRQISTKGNQSARPARKASASGTSTPNVPVTAGSAGTVGGSGKKVKIAPAGKRALAARPPGVGVRSATKGAAAAAAALAPPEGETRKTSHKAAEQKRRDSLKAGFDELRLLLPPINTEALDPESGEPIPGSSAPRLLPKSSLVPDDNPNRGVSKVALLKFGNEYIERLHEKVEKRDDYIERLRSEVTRLRLGIDGQEEVRGADGEDLLEMNMLDGEEEEEDYDGADEEGEEREEEDEIEVDDLELDLDAEEEEEDEMELDSDRNREHDADAKARRRSKPPPPPPRKSPALKPTKRSSINRKVEA